MPNFNTKDMKVAIYPVSEDKMALPLPKESVEKLKALIAYVIDREEDIDVVVAIGDHFVDNNASDSIIKVMFDKGGRLHSDADGTLLFFTAEHHLINIKLTGSSGKFINRYNTLKSNMNDQDDADEDFEDATGQGLTQEVNF